MYRGMFTYNMLSKDSSAEGGLELFPDHSLVECGCNVHRKHRDYQRGSSTIISSSAQMGEMNTLIDGGVEKSTFKRRCLQGESESEYKSLSAGAVFSCVFDFEIKMGENPTKMMKSSLWKSIPKEKVHICHFITCMSEV